LGFYQLLETVGLSTPAYRLGQALVCLELGDLSTARTLLQPLAEHPALAEEAAGLLARMEPAPRAAPPAAAERVGIALQRRGGHHLVPVRLNDAVAVTLLIDTGASITSLSQERFNELSRDTFFEYRGWRIFNTAGGHVRGNIYRANTLRLGEQVLEDVDIAVLDFRQGSGVDGLLGMNVLRHYRFEIDQDRDVLTLQRR
jgi:clan AA aspartic protease (TIGR02281 family)